MLIRLYRTTKQILVIPLVEGAPTTQFPVTLQGSVAFWLDSRTICHVVTAEASDEQELFAIRATLSNDKALAADHPLSIGKLPPAASARYAIFRMIQVTPPSHTISAAISSTLGTLLCL